MTSQHEEPLSGHGGTYVLHETLEVLEAHAETSHTDYGLTFLVDGWFRMEHGTEIYVEPGSVVLMPAGAPHRPMEGADLEYWLVGFCATCVKLDETHLLMQSFHRVRHGALPIIHIPRSKRRQLVRMFRDLHAESLRGTPESPELSRCLLLLLLGEIYRAMPKPAVEVPQDGSLVSSALAYIQQHCLEAISLRDVADFVHRTPSHVASTVKNATGHSVGTWINSGRLGEAANRLAHTDDSLDEIASNIGWQDKTHFIRQFRKVYGVTPAAWRRQNVLAHQRNGQH